MIMNMMTTNMMNNIMITTKTILTTDDHDAHDDDDTYVTSVYSDRIADSRTKSPKCSLRRVMMAAEDNWRSALTIVTSNM